MPSNWHMEFLARAEGWSKGKTKAEIGYSFNDSKRRNYYFWFDITDK